MIKPTVGRVIWYWHPGAHHEDQPWPALITFVHSDNMINVGGFNKNGNPFADTSVLLHQDDQSYGDPGGGGWAAWMPFQRGQAAKIEALEKPAAESTGA